MGTPEEKILELAPQFNWKQIIRHIYTDPIDMFYKLGDVTQQEITVLRLETFAAIYRALADGSTKAAQVISGAKSQR